jgi:peroxiredoxin
MADSSAAHSNASILPAGTRAPDFELPAGPDKTVSLRQFRGKPVILAFYPADFSPVCGDQMALYNEVLPDFADQGAQMLGISVDGPWCHKAMARSQARFPLLSDFEPKGRRQPAPMACTTPSGARASAPVRDRQERRHRVELPLADRREPGRRRHPRGAGGLPK